MAKSAIQKFLDAGMQLSELSKQQAEGLVKTLVKGGEMRRRDAERAVEEMVARGRQTTERLAALIQAEVGQQVATFATRVDELERRIEALTASVRGGKPAAAESASAPTPPAAANEPAANKPAANKTGAKKTGAKKTAAKKTAATASGTAPRAKKAARTTAATPATATKASAGAGSAAEPVGSSGVRKVSATRRR